MRIFIFITLSESYIHVYKSVHIVSRILYPLSKQAQLPNNADNLRITVYTHRRAHARTYMRIISLLSSSSWRNASHENLEIKQTHPRQTAGVHLLRSPCYLLRKTRGSEISSPFTAIPLSTTFSLLCLILFSKCSSYPRHVRRSYRKREQCRGIAILCNQPRAVSALACFPSLFRCLSSLFLSPLSCSCIDCASTLLVPCIRPHVSISA